MRSDRSLARIAGLLYLISIVVAGTASVHVLPRLIVPEDAVATAANITQSPWMLQLAIAGDLVTLLCEVALSALFYVLLRPLDRTLALLVACFRLAFSAMLIANVPNLVTPLQLLAGERYLAAFPPGELPALALVSLGAYRHGYALALLCFGAHILLLGLLLYRSRYVPKALGAWLAVGSLGYFIYSFGDLAVPGVQTSLLLAAPAGIGELVLSLLLLSGRVKLRSSPPAPAQPGAA